MIRVGILARAASDDTVHWTGSRPSLEDHGMAVTTDGYRRSLAQVTEAVRNLAL